MGNSIKKQLADLSAAVSNATTAYSPEKGFEVLKMAKAIYGTNEGKDMPRTILSFLNPLYELAANSAKFFTDDVEIESGKLTTELLSFGLHVFTETKNREQKLRNQLNKFGYALKKSRSKNLTADNQGMYMVIDNSNGCVLRGSRFELTLSDVEEFAIAEKCRFHNEVHG